jgi:hypothetical protein
MEIINLTPHAINYINDEAEITIFPPSGDVARVEQVVNNVYYINNMPVRSQAFGDITGLPDSKEDTLYIVSSIVLEACFKAGRMDVIAPDTSPGSALRNELGHIVGVKGFACKE